MLAFRTKSRIFCFLLSCVCFTYLTSFAQKQHTVGASDILLDIKKLKVDASVLYIAAHPDDENTRLLTYFSKEKQFRTAYLSLTNGEGGQNLIGDEQGVALGHIRKQELLAARRIDGAEQYFANALDFGYSKSKEETLKKWDKEKILDTMVRIIRSFKPDIIITRFPPDKRAGHGHHAASALLAAEAFELAADPAVFKHHFPEGLSPWKSKSLFWNTYNFGSANTIAPSQLKIDVGGFNPILGKNYGEIAAESRSQHKSQGFGSAAQRGTQWEYFVFVKGDSINGVLNNDVLSIHHQDKIVKKINHQIDKIISNYKIDNPTASVRELIKLYKLLSLSHRDSFKLSLIRQLIINASGLFSEAYTDNAFAVGGDSLFINAVVINRSRLNVKLQSVQIGNTNTDTVYNNLVLPYNQPFKQIFALLTPTLSQNITDKSFCLTYHLLIDDFPIKVTRQVQYKFTDPVKGEIFWPLSIYPQYTIEPLQKLFLLNTGDRNLDLLFKVKSLARRTSSHQLAYLYRKATNGNILLKSFLMDSVLDNDGMLHVRIPADDVDSLAFFYLQCNGAVYDQYIRLIEYDHIPAIPLFEKSIVAFPRLNYTITSKKIGYIKGAGDWVDEAIRLMGCQVDILSKEDLFFEKLSNYDAIVTGVRAYNQHDWLTDKHNVLMRYVDSGGVMLIQYNTSSQIGPLKNTRWLFPFTISRNRVSEEDAHVSILEPDHSVFNYPNKITSLDFNHWIQERSVYETDSIGINCKSLLSMHDQDEPDRKGSLILEERGKGRLIYTGLTFFRQLPAGVTGAFRLFANLLSKPPR